MATKKLLNSVKWDFIILSVCYILLGLLFLLYPEASGTIICYLFGAVLCLLGIIRVFSYITTPVADGEFHLHLVSGIVIIAAGVFIFAKPAVLLSISSGILLLREIDSGLTTPAANNLLIGSGCAIIFGAPILGLVGIAPISELLCWLTMGLLILYLIGLLLFMQKAKRKK